MAEEGEDPEAHNHWQSNCLSQNSNYWRNVWWILSVANSEA